jgi:CDP-paratose 2-epimerase
MILKQKKNKKKILISGSCGVVGSNIINNLTKKYSIYGLDNFYRYGSKFNHKNQKDNFIFNKIDINSKLSLDKINFEPDVIIHLASETSVTYGINNSPEYLLKTNTIGTLNILERFKKKNLKFIFLSTSRVYSIEDLNNLPLKNDTNRYILKNNHKIDGIKNYGITENFNTNGRKSFYGLSKLFSEDLILEYAKLYGFNVIINRCGLLTGTNQWGKSSQGLMSYFVYKALKNELISITGFKGSGLQVRDFLNIKDLVNLLDLQIKNRNNNKNVIYNVGGGIKNSFSINELIDAIEKNLNLVINVKRLKISHQNDIGYYITNNEKISRDYNWQPEIDLKQTIKDIEIFVKKNIKLMSKTQ